MFRLNCKKKLIIFLSTIIFLLSVPIYEAKAAESFIITNMDVNIDVTENNYYNIIETIDVAFSQPRHGIFRDIPLKYDGKNKRISNIKVVDEIGAELAFSKSKVQGQQVIKIGDEDKFVEGNKRYVISYTINMGNDGLNAKDLFHNNIIGTQWDTLINKATFKVTMPKEFNPNDVQVVSGGTGSTSNKKVNYRVEGNTIIGETTEVLGNYEGITVKLPLPNEYFVNMADDESLNVLDFYNNITLSPFIKIVFIVAGIAFIALIVGVVLAAVVRYKYIKSYRDIVAPISFYPPEDMGTGELGYIYNKRISVKDMLSYVIYWNNKGYTKIISEKDDLIVKFFKDTVSEKNFEKHLYTLFKNYSTDNIVRFKTLGSKFNKIIFRVAKELMGYVDRTYNLFDSKLIVEGKRVIIFSTIMIVTMMGCVGYINTEELKWIALGMIIAGVFVYVLNKLAKYILDPSRIWIDIKRNCVYLVFALVLIVIVKYLSNLDSSLNLFIYVLQSIASLFMGIVIIFSESIKIALFGIKSLNLFIYIAFIIYMLTLVFAKVEKTLNNEKSIKLYGEVLGFREFLITAEKDKLETLIYSDPQYAYKILPYAMVFGITKLWTEKFKNIELIDPTWDRERKHKDRFDIVREYDQVGTERLNDTEIANKIDINVASSSFRDSGGSSSGDSVGDGSGGGGGGSW